MPYAWKLVICLAGLALLMIWVGRRGGVPKTLTGGWGSLALMVDDRNRFSLNRFQLWLWTWLVMGTFLAMFWHTPEDSSPAFHIPEMLLGLVGISTGSAALAGVVKASKDANPEVRKLQNRGGMPSPVAVQRYQKVREVRAATPAVQEDAMLSFGVVPDPDEAARQAKLEAEEAKAKAEAEKIVGTHFTQMFLEEEGAGADKVISTTKFQNFIFTAIVAGAYLVLAFKEGGYPVFDERLLWLLGISHGGYITGKMPTQSA